MAKALEGHPFGQDALLCEYRPVLLLLDPHLVHQLLTFLTHHQGTWCDFAPATFCYFPFSFLKHGSRTVLSVTPPSVTHVRFLDWSVEVSLTNSGLVLPSTFWIMGVGGIMGEDRVYDSVFRCLQRNLLQIFCLYFPTLNHLCHWCNWGNSF